MKAFPVTKFNSHRVGHDGMDLRDYFAAAALQGILANPETEPETYAIIKAAFQVADAMLEARNK